MEHRSAFAAAIDAVEHQAVEMSIQVGGGAKALDEGDGAVVGFGGRGMTVSRNCSGTASTPLASALTYPASAVIRAGIAYSWIAIRHA